MRAHEFDKGITISIPINITIPAGGGIPTVGTIAAPAGDELPDQAMFIPPLQQHLELAKQQGGRESEAINQIIKQTPEDIAAANAEPEPEPDDDADRILELLKRRRERLDQI